MCKSDRRFTASVRLAAVDDIPSIAMVLHQAFVEYESLYTPAGFAMTTPTARQIDERWHEGPVWVSMQQGRMVGTVAAVPKGDALYIRSMAVVPGLRGQGIGRLLLDQVECYASDSRFLRLLLSTTPFLQGAIRLYERFGFERTRDQPGDLAGTPLFTMEKAVTLRSLPM